MGYINVPEDDECLITAVHISKIIEEPPHTIRSWADEFEDFLYIKKINGRFSYTNKSIEQFEFIKKLRREKNFSIKQIKDQLRIKGFHYEDNESGLINTDDINLMESIKVDIGIEVKNQLKDFLNVFMEAQSIENTKMINSIKTDVEQTVQEQISESMSGIEKQLKEQKEVNQKLSQDRAQSVADFLKTQNVPASQFKEIVGKNFAEPVADNKTAAGKKANRRVEVYMYASAKMINDAANEAK